MQNSKLTEKIQITEIKEAIFNMESPGVTRNRWTTHRILQISF